MQLARPATLCTLWHVVLPQEDIMEEPAPRMFWPRDIWGTYAPNGVLEDFKEPAARPAALRCLNHMVRPRRTHALSACTLLSMQSLPTACN